MRTSNPALNAKTFERFGPGVAAGGETMTIEGTVNRTAFLLLLLVATATWTWSQTFAGAATGGYLLGGIVGGFVVALVTIFKPTWAPVTAPIYAALEGLALGAISAYFEARYPGIVIPAVALTFGVMFALLLAYRSGLIPVTQKFRLGVVAATGGIAIFISRRDRPELLRDPHPVPARGQLARHRLQPVRGRHRLAEPGAGLRFHREGRRARRPQSDGVVRGVRADRDPDLVVSGDSQAAQQVAQPLNSRSPGS